MPGAGDHAQQVRHDEPDEADHAGHGHGGGGEEPGTPQEPEEPQNPSPEDPQDPDDPGPQGPGPQGPGPQDSDTSGTVQEGRLDWGVKESLRGYVTGPIASGDVELSDGYRFPAAGGEIDPEAAALDADFAGGVRFTGHVGALDLRFSELSIEV
ncbi:hypothetical protein E1265_10445 [Streptomyces sp. 8K308]|nr:hypothetical protein E1265_10445 [Streptomyces sp. 8K308]